MERVRIVVSCAIVLGLVGAAPMLGAAGEIPDHLACRELDDAAAARAKIRLDSRLDSAGERSCKLTKTAMLCSPAARISTVPMPPLDVIDGAELPGDFVCYRARCRSGAGEKPVADAFGERIVKLRRSSLVCVPASLGDHL